MEIIEKNSRQLIPRWHTSRKLRGFRAPGTVDSSTTQIAIPSEFRIDEALEDWRKEKSIIHAVELFSKLNLMESSDNTLIQETYEYLKLNSDFLSPAISNIIQPTNNSIDSSILYCTEKNRLHEIISILKRRVRLYPEDSFTWNDLGFYYAVLGQIFQAKHCMKIAFECSKRNPIIARAYSRLLLESDEADPEMALSIINSSSKLYRNPFLDSAELAIQLQYGVGIPKISKAIKLIERYSSRPDLITELSASVATEEIRNGAIKNGKKRLITAAIAPTENTISQLHWIHNRQKIDLSRILDGMQDSVEAKVLDLYKKEEFLSCREELMNLHDFQPFSSKAIVEAGFISLTALNDPDFVIETFERYKSITSKNLVARNNYAVALIEKGEISKAQELILENVNTSSNENEVFLSKATTALLLYKLGESIDGKKLYEQVVNQFKIEKKYGELANVLYHFGKEEIQHNQINGLKLLKESQAIIKEKDVGKTLKLRVEKIVNHYSGQVKPSGVQTNL